MQIAKYSLSKALNRIKLIDIGAYKTKIELWTVGLQTPDVNIRKIAYCLENVIYVMT